jgi:serine/threonine protein kinase
VSERDKGGGPSRVGRYEILRELGRGAMGVVYEAQDPVLGRTIALKTIHPSVGGKDDREAFESRFFTEARVVARLQHPGIVVVHEVGRDAESGILYIALEHLKGRTLADLTDGGRTVGWRKAARILARVARALHHAHAHGITHRDMKPANVMVLDTGETKIMDFGIAKIEAALHPPTAAGEFLGTPLYMAPEQAQGGPVGPRTDVFALGAIGYSLLTGRPAFLGENVARIVMRVVNEDPRPPSQLVPGVPPELDGILARALAKDPASRYPDARSVAEDLEAALEGRTPPHLLGGVTARPNPGPELELVLADDDPGSIEPRVAEPAPSSSAAEPSPAKAGAQSPPTYSRTWAAPGPPVESPHSQPVPPSVRAETWRRLARRSLLVAFGVLGGVAVSYFLVDREEVPGAATVPGSPAAEAPAAPEVPASPAPEASPEPQTGSGEAGTPDGQLAVDFEHTLKTGQLRIWLDGELIVEQRLAGQASKKGLVFTVRKGSYRDMLEVPPGHHSLRVQVKWDDSERSERIAGTFEAGETRRLQVRLGRLRKNLSLEWE